MNSENLQSDIHDPFAQCRYEFIDTNGIGGYCSSTPLLCNTRRYHGLLTAPLSDPCGKFVLLSKIDDSFVMDGKEFPLTVNRYPLTVHPHGHLYVKSFSSLPFPETVYATHGLSLTRQIMMIDGMHTVIIRYIASVTQTGVKNHKKTVLHIHPLLAYRDYNCLTRENPYFNTHTEKISHSGHRWVINPYTGMPPLTVDIVIGNKKKSASSMPEFTHAPYWNKDVALEWEERRGFPAHEDLCCPGRFSIPVVIDNPVYVSFSADENAKGRVPADYNPEKEWQKEITRRQNINTAISGSNAYALYAGIKGNKAAKSLRERLFNAADKFFIRNPLGQDGIIAGYHWFGEWGRDTLIALPGLAFARGRFELGLKILKDYASHLQGGLIPNMLGYTSSSDAYNSIDASLFFFYAAGKYIEFGGKITDMCTALFTPMTEILTTFTSGTVPYGHLTEEGLLYTGDETTQLTWMDAMVHGKPVTPRHGLAVDINALWYYACKLFLLLYEELNKQGNKNKNAVPVPGKNIASLVNRLGKITSGIESVFSRTFYQSDHGFLADTVRDNFPDMSLRPNQLFAIALNFSPLGINEARKSFNAVKDNLLTPYGLRTLSPGDSRYRSRYCGGPEERDSAYHQGTVWPWLVGPYTDAALKVSDNPVKEAYNIITYLDNLLHYHLYDGGLDSISEIFDGSDPQYPAGCIAQAWSAGEVIRAYVTAQAVITGEGKINKGSMI